MASLAGVAFGLVRSVLLARLLPIEVFGVYALASSVVALTAPLPSFAMTGAFLHRAPETEDEDLAAAVHFTLRLVFTSIWMILLALGALLFTSGQDRLALLALAIIRGCAQFAHTPRLVLIRRIVHRRLALIAIVDTALSTLIALALAWRGVTLWALLSTDLVTLLVSFIALYVWVPVWRPRLVWSAPIVRYYLSFGSRILAADLISEGLDRVDDLWTGLFLGKTALSFYSRAYTFAIYPRSILAAPINMVAGGTYAELKDNRPGLSRAFFRTNALLVRSGFGLAGLLVLIAPEFIRLILGARWLPMLEAFRLMLVFTLLDPIKVTVGSLFIAVGRPGDVLKARSIQFGFLIAGLFLMGPWLGITGVALAVDVMLFVGMAILLWKVRDYVDFSPWRLFGVPTLALMSALVIAYAASNLPVMVGSDWRTGLVKVLSFTIIYGVLLLALEAREFVKMIRVYHPREFLNRG